MGPGMKSPLGPSLYGLNLSRSPEAIVKMKLAMYTLCLGTTHLSRVHFQHQGLFVEEEGAHTNRI